MSYKATFILTKYFSENILNGLFQANETLMLHNGFTEGTTILNNILNV